MNKLFIAAVLAALCAPVLAQSENLSGLVYVRGTEVRIVNPLSTKDHGLLAYDLASVITQTGITSDGESFFYRVMNGYIPGDLCVYTPATGKSDVIMTTAEMMKTFGEIPEYFFPSRTGNGAMGESLMVNMGAKGYTPEPLAKGANGNFTPCWDEKGTTFVYRAADGLFATTVGGKTTKISDNGEPIAAADGKIYTREGNDVFVCGFDGSGKKKILSVSENYFFNACAARGSEFAYADYDFMNGEIKIRLPLSGRNIVFKPQRAVSSVINLMFDPQGRYLIFTTEVDDNCDGRFMYRSNIANGKTEIIAAGVPVGFATVKRSVLKKNKGFEAAETPEGFEPLFKLEDDFDGDGKTETAFYGEKLKPTASMGQDAALWIVKDGKKIAADARKAFNNGSGDPGKATFIIGLDKFFVTKAGDGKARVCVIYDIPGWPPYRRIVIYDLAGDKLTPVFIHDGEVTDIAEEPDFYVASDGSVYVTDEYTDGEGLTHSRGLLLRYVWDSKKFSFAEKKIISDSDASSTETTEELVKKYFK
ncbi:MAG: hypothetical protein J6332_01000 [Abditibacteriota bacterium]|nr:hypothetical protein [Abditibacteriota bacterium]